MIGVRRLLLAISPILAIGRFMDRKLMLHICNYLIFLLADIFSYSYVHNTKLTSIATFKSKPSFKLFIHRNRKLK